jgi:hypothetical protein
VQPRPEVIQLPPEVVTFYRYVTVPPDYLSCLAEPRVPNALTDVELAQWAQLIREAGEDCRAKLDAVRKLSEQWEANNG